MILSIFKKDFRLLWPWALATALLQAGLAAFEFTKGPFSKTSSALEFAKLGEIERLLEGAVLVALALLISLVVHQDAIPQVDFDWLVRPIRRSKLALAKVTFFIVCIHLPMFIVDAALCLATGFDLPHSLCSSLSRTIFVFITFTIPLFSIAAVTKSTIDFVISVATAVLIVVTLDRLFLYFFNAELLHSIFTDDLGESNWVIVFLKYFLMTIGSLTVIYLQYFRRKTGASRVVFMLFIALGFSVNFFPWQLTFRAQELMSSSVSPDSPFSVSFDPTLAVSRILNRGTDQEGRLFYLPIRISGLPDGARLVLNAEEAAPIEIGGQSLTGITKIVTDGPEGPWLANGSRGNAYLTFYMSRQRVDDLKDSPAIDISLELAVTVLEEIGNDKIFALSDDYAPFPKLGRCRVRNPGRLAMGLAPLVAECAQAGPVSDVTTMAAFSPDQGAPFASGMSRFGYSPFFAQLLPDAINRVSVGMLPMTTVPIAELYPNSHIIMRNYRSVMHRYVHLTIVKVHPQDWPLKDEDALVTSSEQKIE